MTTTSSLTPADFTSPISFNGNVFFNRDTVTNGEIANLDPTVTATLYIWARGLASSESPTILIQDKPASIASYPGLSASVTHTVTLDPERPPTFSISGWAPDSSITATLTLSDVPEGTARLKVLALLPNPRHASAVLGSAVLGGFKLPSAAAPAGFTLGRSALGAATLPSTETFHVWTDLTPQMTTVQIERGISHNGISGRAEIGTMTADLLNGPAPRAIGLTRGTPIRVIDAATRTRLFTGILDRAPSESRTPAGDRRTGLTAVDTMATLAAIPRYQLTPPEGSAGWIWTTVVGDLLDKHAILWQTTGPAEPGLSLGPTATEGTLTSYLDMYLATSAVSWWIDRDGTVTASHTPPTAPKAIISDRPISSDLPVLHHIAETQTFDTSAVISTLSITNHSITIDEDGTISPTQTELTIRNPELAKTYGETSATIDTAALALEDLETYGTKLLASYKPRPVLTSARFTPIKGLHQDDAQLSVLTGLDVMDTITSHMLGESSPAAITMIRHTITPTSWQTTLSLTERRH